MRIYGFSSPTAACLLGPLVVVHICFEIIQTMAHYVEYNRIGEEEEFSTFSRSFQPI